MTNGMFAMAHHGVKNIVIVISRYIKRFFISFSLTMAAYISRLPLFLSIQKGETLSLPRNTFVNLLGITPLVYSCAKVGIIIQRQQSFNIVYEELPSYCRIVNLCFRLSAKE
jgi:hypothetical protein